MEGPLEREDGDEPGEVQACATLRWECEHERERERERGRSQVVSTGAAGHGATKPQHDAPRIFGGTPTELASTSRSTAAA